MRDAGVTEQKREWLDEASRGDARLRSRLAAALRTPADTDVSYLDQLGFPGQFPYTRGIEPNEYRGRLWQMGQGSGLGAAGAVGGRSRHEPVVKEGRVSVVFDAPTELARDSDDPRAEGAVGIKGAPLDSIEDMASLLEGMRLEELDVSLMASTGNTSIVLAYFIAVAQERGIPLESLSGYAPRGRSATGRAPRVCRAAAVAWRF